MGGGMGGDGEGVDALQYKDEDGDLAPGTTARLESLERIRSSQFIESQSLERSLAASPEDP